MNYNEVKLSGIINNIYDNVDSKYILFRMICNNYSKENNEIIVNLRIFRNLYNIYKDFFILNQKVIVKGYINSYKDKNNILNNYVTVTNVYDSEHFNLNANSHIEYENGVMIWHGKRCEKSRDATPKERQEMEELLREYR